MTHRVAATVDSFGRIVIYDIVYALVLVRRSSSRILIALSKI